MKRVQTNKQQFILLIFFISFSCACKSQNTVSIYNSNTVLLEFTSPFIAGSPISNISTNTSWLNYTIVHTPPEPTFSIAVEISSGYVSNGLELKIEAGTYEGSGGEQPGIPTGQIIITNEPQVLVYNIGTCSSGSGTDVGHQLTYSLNITNYSQLSAISSTTCLLFTITQ